MQVFRPPWRVARPADWTGTLTRVGLGATTLMLLVAAGLARLPPLLTEWAWVQWAGGPLAVRAVLGVLVLLGMRWVGAFVYARLPSTPYVLFNRLTFRERGRRRQLTIDELQSVEIELRPSPVRQALVVRTAEGTVHELCPLWWSGAARLYAALERKIRRAERRRLAKARAAESVGFELAAAASGTAPRAEPGPSE